MNNYRVNIPGVTAPYAAIADTPEAALSDALFFHGLRCAPPGTLVTWLVPAWR